MNVLYDIVQFWQVSFLNGAYHLFFYSLLSGWWLWQFSDIVGSSTREISSLKHTELFNASIAILISQHMSAKQYRMF